MRPRAATGSGAGRASTTAGSLPVSNDAYTARRLAEGGRARKPSLNRARELARARAAHVKGGRMLRCSLPATLALATLLAACKGPAVPHPMTNATRYLCCNLHYEKPEISDVNYLKGTLIPFGTRVHVLEVRKSTVKFQAEGHPPITLVLKYGKDAIGMDQYLELIFLREDPHAKTPAASAGHLVSAPESCEPGDHPGDRTRRPCRRSKTASLLGNDIPNASCPVFLTKACQIRSAVCPIRAKLR